MVGLDHLIALRLLAGEELFFVQIGAFDGRTGDQLHDYIVRYPWRGILVEPQPHWFAELERVYAEQADRLSLRNVAISETAGTRTMYAVRADAPDAPWWGPQTASFERSHLLGQDVDPALIEEHAIDCVSLEELLAGVDHVDLLQVDVEGYDAEIIRMFDFERYRPSIVRFESRHLTGDDHDAAIERLISFGYSVAVSGPDTLAWRDLSPAG